jgi:hypothetical protein
MRLRRVVDLVGGGIHGARRHLVQKRLPKMGSRTVDKREVRLPAPAQPVAEPCRKLEAPRAAAAAADPVWTLVVRPICYRHDLRHGVRTRARIERFLTGQYINHLLHFG